LAPQKKRIVNFGKEVWRRRVLQVAIPYGIGGWALIEVAELVLSAYSSPPWILKGVLTLVLGGFPIAIVLAWIFDITQKGNMVVTRSIEESEVEFEPAPAVSLEMGDSERRKVTVLACECEFVMQGNSAVDPEYMHDTLASFSRITRDLAQRFRGHELPSGSQELKLVFGYPQARGGDARRAVAAGLALNSSLKKALESNSFSNELGLSIRIGIATGLVVADESGASDRNVNIIGLTPRMASWLQSLATPGSVVIGPQTRELVGDHFQLEPLGSYSNTQLGGEIEVFTVEEALTSGIALGDQQMLIGREDEMHLLADRWENVIEEEGEFVVLMGEAGIGKSSLVRTFLDRFNDGQVPIIPCQCSPYEQHNPLSPIIRMLQGPVLRFTEEDDSGTRLRKLKNFVRAQNIDDSVAVPLLAKLLSLDTGNEYEIVGDSAANQRMRTLELFLDMISLAAAKQPTLMIFEDIHWADPSTLEMIQILLDRGPVPGLFLLFTARPEFKADWTKRSYVLVHDLLPLVKRSARKLIETTAGESELPNVIIDRIIKETDGNPLFIRELTLAVIESEQWRDSVAKGRPEDMSWLEIPANLQESLASRIDSLGETKPLLQLCSVLGREFSYRLIRDVSGTENEGALRKELSKIVNSELLFQRGMLRSQIYTFKHILIQETAYNSLMMSKRRELHGRTARILEQEFPEVAQRQPALLAYHYTEAGDLEKAIENWTFASRQSLDHFANPEAIEQARRGIELLESTPESAERAAQIIPLQSLLGTALLATHGYAHAEVRKTYSKALELCEQIGDAPQLFRVVVGLWMHQVMAARFDEALDLGQRLVRIAETTQNPAEHLQARYCLAYVLLYRAEFMEAKLHLEGAIESEREDCDYSAQSASGDDTRVHVRSILSLVYWHLGRHRSAVRVVEEARALAIEQNSPFGRVFSGFFSAWLHQLRGDAKATLTDASDAAKISEEKGFHLFLILNQFMIAWTLCESADSKSDTCDTGGVEALKASLDNYLAIGPGAGQTYLNFVLAEEYIGLSMFEEATALIESTLPLMQTTGELFMEPEYYRLNGKIHMKKFSSTGHSGDLNKAEELFNQALVKARRHESKGLELRAVLDRAEALSMLDRDDAAERLLTGMSRRFEESDKSRDFVRLGKMLKKLSINSGRVK